MESRILRGNHRYMFPHKRKQFGCAILNSDCYPRRHIFTKSTMSVGFRRYGALISILSSLWGLCNDKDYLGLPAQALLRSGDIAEERMCWGVRHKTHLHWAIQYGRVHWIWMWIENYLSNLKLGGYSTYSNSKIFQRHAKNYATHKWLSRLSRITYLFIKNLEKQ